MGFQLSDDYITVAERIVEFRTKHPDGTLQPWDKARPYTIEQINGSPYIVVVAAAYRDADDECPGIGMAYEPVPGSTPYTRGSELQNAETAAWGRAIVAALAADTKKGIASYEEVRVQQDRREEPPANPAAQKRLDAREQLVADWNAAIDAAKGDYAALGQLHIDAQQKRAPKEVIDRIRTEGNEAKPK